MNGSTPLSDFPFLMPHKHACREALTHFALARGHLQPNNHRRRWIQSSPSDPQSAYTSGRAIDTPCGTAPSSDAAVCPLRLMVDRGEAHPISVFLDASNHLRFFLDPSPLLHVQVTSA